MDNKITETVNETLIHQSRPITCIHTSAGLILASEGSVLHVFDRGSTKLVASQVVHNKSEPIHSFYLNENTANRILVFVNLKRGAKILSFSLSDRRFENFLQDDGTLLLEDSHVIAATWMNNDRAVAAISNENFLNIIQLPTSDCHSTLGSTGCTVTTRKGVGTSLFSAFIHGESEKNLIVFSGTNLGQIYVWAPSDATANYHFLIDNIKGSVLSITFSAATQTLIASSDERTAYTWTFDAPLSVQNLKENKVTAGNVTVMTGHTGRVWSTDVNEPYIVTAGQDGKALLWTMEGQLLRMFSHASVFSIRCCKFDKDTSCVILGSDDGSIHQWFFESHVKTEVLFTGTSEDYPRQIIFDQDASLLLSSQKGSILNVPINSATSLPQSADTKFTHSDLVDHNVMALSPETSVVAVGSKSGSVHVLHLNGNRSVSSFHSKIVSIRWLSVDQLLVATTKQVFLLAIESNVSVNLKCTFAINWKEKPGVPSAIQLTKNKEEYLVLSDVYGKMHVVHLKRDVENDSTIAEVVHVTPKAHGSYGVCDMHRGLSKTLDEFWTVGRSKLVKKWKLQNEESNSLVKLACVQTLTSRIPWNSRMFWAPDRLILVGFAENDFVIYDQTRDIIIQKIPCGGAHRSWDIKIDDKAVFQFVYLRNKAVHMVTGSPGSKILKQSGTSGKTINVVLNIPNLCDSNLLSFILAGEDGILKLVQCPLRNLLDPTQAPQSTHFEELANFKDHISSVRAVSTHSITQDKLLVFSGGGRSQVIASSIDLSTTPPTWTHQSSIIIPPITPDSATTIDMRIMDISVFSRSAATESIELLCACSDGFFRLLKYQSASVNSASRNSRLVVEFAVPLEQSSPLHAITSAHVLLNVHPSKEPLALIANSVGQLSTVVLKPSSAIKPDYSVQATRSCIITLGTTTLNDIVYVVTGADDGHVKFWIVSFSDSDVEELRLMYESKDHHCAAVNCLYIEGTFVFAASADGIVCKTEIGSWQTQVYRIGTMDVQSISVSVRQDSAYVIAAGQGVEVVKIAI